MDLPATSAECFPVILVAFADHINTDCAVMDHGLAVWAAVVGHKRPLKYCQESAWLIIDSLGL